MSWINATSIYHINNKHHQSAPYQLYTVKAAQPRFPDE